MIDPKLATAIIAQKQIDVLTAQINALMTERTALNREAAYKLLGIPAFGEYVLPDGSVITTTTAIVSFIDLPHTAFVRVKGVDIETGDISTSIIKVPLDTATLPAIKDNAPEYATHYDVSRDVYLKQYGLNWYDWYPETESTLANWYSNNALTAGSPAIIEL